MTSTKTTTSSQLKIRASYEIFSHAGRKDRCEIRDTARGGLVVYAGTYRQCVAESKRRGIWFS